MSSRITYENKKALQNDENVARENKVTDLDLNEIKEVVNSHANDIENFKNYDDTEVKQDIINIKQEQEAQNTDIEALQSSISEINEKNNAQDEEIEALKQENIELRRTQDDMIEKQLNKQSEVDTSVIAKDTDEFYGKLNVYGGQRQEKRAGINLIDVGKLRRYRRYKFYSNNYEYVSLSFNKFSAWNIENRKLHNKHRKFRNFRRNSNRLNRCSTALQRWYFCKKH